MNDPRGSIWRKWDLHIHTPDSIYHNFTDTDPWERFLRELEQLPSEFKVIGINRKDFDNGLVLKKKIEESDVIINVSGTSIAGIWTRKKRKDIYLSRVIVTRKIRTSKL